MAGIGRRPHKLILQGLALVALKGVGDKATGEWHEWTGYAYHVRRRLTPEEQERVGPVLDCRRTAEFDRRYPAAVRHLPEAAKRMALEEGKGA